MKTLFRSLWLVGSSTIIFVGSQPVAAQVTVAQQGKSSLTVIVAENAPASVKKAAQELQTCLQLATGAYLPLQNGSATVGSPYISLGSTPQAKAAGVSTQGMADEAYRIVTKNGNLYILGPDTADGGWTKTNGVSNGTAHGVYSLLEDYLGVRWLMPGDIGRDVPKQPTLTLPTARGWVVRCRSITSTTGGKPSTATRTWSPIRPKCAPCTKHILNGLPWMLRVTVRCLPRNITNSKLPTRNW
jgi:hypothetical protein